MAGHQRPHWRDQGQKNLQHTIPAHQKQRLQRRCQGNRLVFFISPTSARQSHTAEDGSPERCLSCPDAAGISTTATVLITLKETNDFPPQLLPVSGSVCRDSFSTGSGLVLTAVDQDLPPHAAPFRFEMPDHTLVNWTVVQVNGESKCCT